MTRFTNLLTVPILTLVFQLNGVYLTEGLLGLLKAPKDIKCGEGFKETAI